MMKNKEVLLSPLREKKRTASLYLDASLRGWQISHAPAKRLFDILFSITIIFLLAPLFVAIAIAIRLSSPGKIIYSQQRFGQRGKVFNCYKFRTMYADADLRLCEILEKDSQLRTQWERNQKLHDDPRVFPFGKYLRKLSLDELPQFFNVLKGDLSIVGPRPYMLSQWKKIAPFANQILKIRPGITGLWQTSGRSRTTFYERITLDKEYVNRYSFWLDIWLILKTIPQVFFAKDAC